MGRSAPGLGPFGATASGTGGQTIGRVRGVVPVVLVRRSWLLWGPLLFAWQLGCAWAVDSWVSWEWVRATAPVLAWLVGIGVALWGMGSVVLVTRGGFWVPFRGRGRWDEVVARDDLDVTLSVSEKYGADRVVSFERVRDWPAMKRLLDARLPSDLPGIETTTPHQEWRERIEGQADDVIARVSRRVTPPASVRTWIRPGASEHSVHSLRVAFEPTVDGSRVELRLGDDWYPELKVDDSYACFTPDGIDEETGQDLPEEDEVATEVAAVLVALFQGATREPLVAWRIADEQRRSWDFYPRPLG